MKTSQTDSFKILWEEGWTYIKTVVDVLREPVLILDRDLRVVVANDPFYKLFQVDAKETEHKVVYDLGNGQWDIPDLRKLLEVVLPKNTFFKGFEVTHTFPIIGKKVMILNARQIHFSDKAASKLFPSIILLAMEDVTEIMIVAETLACHAKDLELKLMERVHKLESQVKKQDKDISKLKKDSGVADK